MLIKSTFVCKCTQDSSNQTIIPPHYDTLLRLVKLSFKNPKLLEKQDIPQEKLLESAAAGMAYPKIKCANWFYFHNAW